MKAIQAWKRLKAFHKKCAQLAQTKEEAFEIGYEAGIRYAIGNPWVMSQRGIKNGLKK